MNVKEMKKKLIQASDSYYNTDKKAMSDQELAMLDDVITPDVAQVLMKLLPELAELIAAVEGEEGGRNLGQPQEQTQEAPEPQMAPEMGALGGMG